MKIAIITNTRPHKGGITTNVNDFSAGLRCRGHVVDVFSIFGKSDRRNTYAAFTKTIDLLLTGKPWLTFLSYRLSLAIILFILRTAFKCCAYDIVWAMDVASWHAAKKFHLPGKNKVLLWVGASMSQDLISQGKLKNGGKLYQFFFDEELSAYRNAQLVISNSIWMRDFIKDICPGACISEPLCNPVNTKLFKPDYESGQKWISEIKLPLDKMIILFPSRLEWRKGPHIAVECLEILVKRFTLPIMLIMLRDGPEKETIRTLVKQKGLDANFRLFSSQPHQELSRTYNAAKVVILPSLRIAKAEESMSNSVLEAMACGIPVVCSAIGGQKSFIQNGRDGILVSENNPEEFAKAIHSILTDCAYAVRLSENGREKIQKYCSVDNVISRLEQYFQNFS